LLETAKELGAAALATGHYITSKRGPGGWELHRAADAERDQSYFLFATTRDQLEILRFPLGHLNKAETRELARRYGLKVAEKSDSQDICFVPTGRYTQVINRLRPGAAQPGDIVALNGEVLGRHDGIINYTIGQRRGLGIAAAEPLYVVKLDAQRSRVIVGPRESLRSSRIWLRQLNWLGDQSFSQIPEKGLELTAKIRSTGAPRRVTLRNQDGAAVVQLHDGEDGVSPGQACVLYDSKRVMGGGWIARAEPDKRFMSEDAEHHAGNLMTAPPAN
jgi:tRNA-specific 2-thiouridylase